MQGFGEVYGSILLTNNISSRIAKINWPEK